MECKSCKLELEKLLCALPSVWRKQIISVVCSYVADQGLDCAQVAACVSDELTTLDFKCLVGSQSEWDALGMNGKIQKIIDKVCEALGSNPIQVSDTPSVNMSGIGTSGDPVTASVIISPDSGNTTVIHSNGIYTPAYVPATPTPLCDQINSAFTEDDGFALDEGTFLVKTNHGGTFDQGECFRVPAPTGFAVNGLSRSSAFGAMQWFNTLTAANNSASSGETVLIYADTSENLVAKAGVSYMGIGNPIIGNLTFGTVTNPVRITNLRIGNVTATTTANVKAVNVTVSGSVSILDNSIWDGGTFIDNSTTVTVNDSAYLKNFYSEKRVNVIGASSIENFDIKYTGSGSGTIALSVNSAATTSSLYVRNGRILTSAEYGVNTATTVGQLVMENIYAESSAGFGVYITCGEQTFASRFIIKNVTGVSRSSSAGLSIVSSRANGDSGATVNNVVVDSCIGYSVSGNGITSLNGTLKRCTGYSEEAIGIFVGTTTQPAKNVLISDCIGESKAAAGLSADGNVFITGGTFVSRGTTTGGTPIVITDPIGTSGFFIAGVKTVAENTSVFGITNGGGSVTARISGCQFLNPNLLTSVPGIDPSITLRAVTIDAYGNMK